MRKPQELFALLLAISGKRQQMGLLAQAAFFPSLAYNIARNWYNADYWPWYSRIDERVILGALPFKSQLPEVGHTRSLSGASK